MGTLNERLSVVMPVFNEEKVIGEVVAGLKAQILDHLPFSEIVVVDDRSTDATPKILDLLAESDPQIRVIHAPVNRGHGPSLYEAIECSSGDWIFHVDSDGQFLASDFWKLWAERDRCPLVLGVRGSRNDPQHRLFLTRIVRLVVGLISPSKIKDANVPFKLFARDLWEKLREFIDPQTLAPSILIATGSAALGVPIAQVDVTHLARKHGVSSLRLFRLVRFSLRGLVQLVRFRLSIWRASH